MRKLFLALLLFPAFVRAESLDKPEERIIVRAPDYGAYVSWTDRADGTRRIELKPSPQTPAVFSQDTFPRRTRAAWNATSTQCLIGDAPDNGNVNFWLVSRDASTPTGWKAVSLDLLAPLWAAHDKLDTHGRHLFRPGLVKIAWPSPTTAEARVTCNEGVFLLTLDATHPQNPPMVKKVSDNILEE